MKRLSLTRILRVLRHAPYLCVLPLPRSLVSASSALVIATLFYASQLIGTWCRELLSVAQSPAHLNTAPSHH
jgi:hypothetical protein